MVDAQGISIIFAGLSIAASIVYYASVLRNANKTQQTQLETRQAQLFMQIFNQWNTTEFGLQYQRCMNWEWTDVDDFYTKYWSSVEDANRFRMISRFFEGIGVLVHRGLIDVTLVDDLMSGETMRFWEMFAPVIEEMRIRLNWPQAVEWVEYLYNEVKAIYDQQHPELKT